MGCLIGMATLAGLAFGDDSRSLVAWSSIGTWERTALDQGAFAYRSPEYVAPIGFDEAVLSWNVKLPEGASARFLVQVGDETSTSDWFDMGTWSQDDRRRSVKAPGTEWGHVDTDTLLLTKPASRYRLQVQFTPGTDKSLPSVKLMALSLLNSKAPVPAEANEKCAAWGMTIDAPKRAQGSYPGGGVLCSPTSVSMILAHWAKIAQHPEWDHDVPEVQSGIHDPVWGGTGNWAFNMAFAGSQDGLVAYVSRLSGIHQLEEWIQAGFPVACSVRYELLKGKEKAGANDGHLVVLVGFDDKGDPVFNDPGRSVVRMTYSREAFRRSWAARNNTVYLVYPTESAVPTDSAGAWIQRPSTASSKL